MWREGPIGPHGETDVRRPGESVDGVEDEMRRFQWELSREERTFGRLHMPGTVLMDSPYVIKWEPLQIPGKDTDRNARASGDVGSKSRVLPDFIGLQYCSPIICD